MVKVSTAGKKKLTNLCRKNSIVSSYRRI